MFRIAKPVLVSMLVVATTSGCVMSEEMKRIQKVEDEKARRKQQMSTNLSGEQIFVRSCNTCHPGGSAGMGPALDQLSTHFPTDEKLISFLRQGVGVMPPQPKEVINDTEMGALIRYLRNLKIEPL